MFLLISTPPGSTAERTLESVKQVENYFLTTEKDNIAHLFTVIGFSFAGNGQNSAMGFVELVDWAERKRDDQSVFSITGRAMGALMQIKDAMAFAIFPPPVQELGNASGFDMQLVDRNGAGHEALMAARNQILGMAAQNPNLVGVRPNGLEDVPEFKIDVDYEKATSFGLSISDINRTLQTAWGGSYINDFVDAGRIKKVYMQADTNFRMNPEDLKYWYVRNNKGEMVPFTSFTTTRWEYGSPKLERFNGIASVNIQGATVPGGSTGTAMDEMEKMVGQLPAGFGVEWSGLSYEEKLAGSQAPMLYAMSILVIFLCLAALYESWSVPFSILLVIPVGVIGAVGATLLHGMANDIYFQVALLTTIGLASKNAILIVEFAKHLYEEGHDLLEATMMAAKQRFRPIIMTSMAFMLGVTPLAISSGAGSAAQNAIGIGVIGGMMASTFLATLFVPMFFIFIQGRFKRKKIVEDVQPYNDIVLEKPVRITDQDDEDLR
jgi:hydrophobe/amphiphile efflux-1 (HAE1) family protein